MWCPPPLPLSVRPFSRCSPPWRSCARAGWSRCRWTTRTGWTAPARPCRTCTETERKDGVHGWCYNSGSLRESSSKRGSTERQSDLIYIIRRQLYVWNAPIWSLWREEKWIGVSIVAHWGNWLRKGQYREVLMYWPVKSLRWWQR